MLLALVAAATAATVLSACDEGADITYMYQTSQQIGVYLGDDEEDWDVTLGPQESKTVVTIKAVWEDVVVFRNDQRGLLYRLELTWDELERQGWRIEITPEMLGEKAEGTSR